MLKTPKKEKVKGYPKDFYSPILPFFINVMEADRNSKEKHRQMLINMGKQRGKSLSMTAFMFKELGLPYRTPFEQAAYDLQHTPKNRVSGPELGATAPYTETTADKQYLFIVLGIFAFIVMLILV